MNRLIAVCLAVLASGPLLAAQTFKWVDERGVTTYGEKPPAGRPAKAVETQPGGTLESGPLQQQKKALESQQQAQPPAAQPAPASARGMDFDTYIRLQVGMSEGEVFLRAGKPDHESVENFNYDVVKTLYYYPTAANPYITTVTLSGGTVTKLDRTKKTF